MTAILTYHLDLLAFAVLCAVGSIVAFALLRRARRAVRWAATVAMVFAAAVVGTFAYWNGEAERARLVDMVSGLAPTYAMELDRGGHRRVGPLTDPTDPTYLDLIEREKRWLAVNPSIADVYTFARNAGGKPCLVVDSETDYDRDGRYEGEREKRTPIGEAYEADDPWMLQALDAGTPVFKAEPYTDRWGTWVSAAYPLRDDAGRVYAAVGIDFPAETWVMSILRLRTAVELFGLVALAVLGTTTVMTCRLRAEVRRRVALQAELTEASRKAGMAEVATGVLHNVGNVLNSVTVSAALIGERLAGSKLPGLGKAAEMIRSQPDPAAFLAADPKGRQLPAYLAKLADLLAAEQEAVRAELAHLARGLDHIKGIVASQQKFAKARAVLEPVPLAELVEDAARINQLGDGVPGGGVEFVRDFRCEPTVTTDRHKVMQILVNLLKNAREAVAAGPGPARRITVGIARAADDGAGGGGAGGFDVTVTDTGVGIAADRLGRLFQHGYTTRKDGHGFGLHAAAIDARNLGGSLSARSDGVGLGATFTLRVVSAKPVGPAADTDSTAAPPVARAA